MDGDSARGDVSLSRKTDSFVRLWDGKLYAREHLEREYPIVAEMAQQVETLHETMPHSAWLIALRQALCYGVGFGVLLMLAQPAIWLAPDAPPRFDIVVGAVVLVLSVVVVFSAARGLQFHWRRPSVWVARGQVHVRVGRRERCVPLADCEWYLATTRHINVFENVILPNDPAVILVLPGKSQHTALVGVGFSAESRRLWEGFLTVAGVPRRMLPTRQAGLGTVLVAVGFGVVVMAVYAPAFYQASRWVSGAVSLLTGNAGMATTLQWIFAFLGTITAWAYTMRLWPSRGLVSVPTRRSPEEQAILRRRITFAITTVCGGSGALFLCCAAPTNIPARLVGTVVWLLWIWLVARDLARREVAVDRELAWPSNHTTPSGGSGD